MDNTLYSTADILDTADFKQWAADLEPEIYTEVALLWNEWHVLEGTGQRVLQGRLALGTPFCLA